MPSIVCWDIEAVVVDEFCKNEGEKQSDPSRLSTPAPTDALTAAKLSAHLRIQQMEAGPHRCRWRALFPGWRCCSVSPVCSAPSGSAAAAAGCGDRNFGLTGSHSAAQLATLKAACEASMKKRTTPLFAFCTPLLPSPGSVFSAVKQEEQLKTVIRLKEAPLSQPPPAGSSHL